MKLLSSYLKEMKIAARGFYFYIEIFVAVLLLIILLYGVKENPDSKQKEFLYNEMPQVVYDNIAKRDLEAGRARYGEPVEWVLKPIEFSLTNQETGETEDYSFPVEKTLTVKALEKLDSRTGKLRVTAYEFPTYEDMLRASYQEKEIGAFTRWGEDGKFYFHYILQGYETERLKESLYILHNDDFQILNDQVEKQVVRELGVLNRLNNRENIVPVFLAYAGAMMGFFIVVAYIFLDKGEGVIKAFAVTPASIYSYLLSKILVICTTVIISSSIIVIPVMRAGPSYPMLYLFLLVSTFAFASLGLVVASFFESMTKSFMILYGFMIVMMIPAFSYFIPSFDPLWLRFFPSYPALQVFKDLLLGTADTAYIWKYTGLFFGGGVILLFFANLRFKKTLTV